MTNEQKFWLLTDYEWIVDCMDSETRAKFDLLPPFAQDYIVAKLEEKMEHTLLYGEGSTP